MPPQHLCATPEGRDDDIPQYCPGLHHQGRIATKMQTSQELQARTGRKEIENAAIRPLKIKQWRPPPEQRKPGSFEFVFYAGPTRDEVSLDPYPVSNSVASWRIPKEAAPRQDLRVPTERFIASRQKIRQYQVPPALALAPAPSLVPIHQAPISMIQQEVNEEDTRINYIRPIPPERLPLKTVKSPIEEDVDDDTLAEQQLVMEYQLKLSSTRARSKKQTRKGPKQVRGGSLRRDSRRKKDPHSTCEEDLIALATGALLKSKVVGLAGGKPAL